MSFGWQKERRLLKRAEFTPCYDEGNKVHSKNFIVFVFRAENTHTRVGLAVTKKIGNAVERNRVKRLLREFCRLNQNILPTSTHIVITAKKHIHVDSLNYSKVEKELSYLFSHKING